MYVASKNVDKEQFWKAERELMEAVNFRLDFDLKSMT